ncbi:cytochrome b [Roseomonas sp. PWR1]|uniref:Cytochrome b n=1 Tax=Roseomonas nitratireducens TaxID=2820810 RepID=A0ABS4AUP3_9PROT|nr:cytochrome b/b6 domain-containing protein [Neoroseomonas nitratireducens]MBP0464262.1 cytochrome b [Neoroseomonas nitratireducens]
MHDQDTAPHSPVTRALHWAGALLVAAAFGLGLMLEDWPRGPQRDYVMMIHYSLGTLVLGLLLVRLVRRLLVPALKAREPGLAGWAATAMHLSLYAMMLALPVTGAFDRWARGRRLAVFDIVIPPPFPIGGGRIWREAHTYIGWAIAAFVLLHVAAALWHHFARRDAVLTRMLPSAARRAPVEPVRLDAHTA